MNSPREEMPKMVKKESSAEESAKKTKVGSKKKRIFKTAPTLRDQTTKQQNSDPNKKSRFKKIFGSKLFAPFRFVGRFLRKIWMTKLFTPIRWIFRWLGKILVPPYFRNSWKELKLVIWPDFRTTWRLTFAVILFSLAFGLFIAGLDVVLEKLFREVLLK